MEKRGSQEPREVARACSGVLRGVPSLPTHLPSSLGALFQHRSLGTVVQKGLRWPLGWSQGVTTSMQVKVAQKAKKCKARLGNASPSSRSDPRCIAVTLGMKYGRVSKAFLGAK